MHIHTVMMTSLTSADSQVVLFKRYEDACVGAADWIKVILKDELSKCACDACPYADVNCCRVHNFWQLNILSDIQNKLFVDAIERFNDPRLNDRFRIQINQNVLLE